jgi:hypothetical protein
MLQNMIYWVPYARLSARYVVPRRGGRQLLSIFRKVKKLGSSRH